MVKSLFLPLMAEWYDKIKLGEKKTEFREVKPYWSTRLKVRPDVVIFARGYTSERMAFEVKGVSVVPGLGTDLNIDAPVFAIDLGKRIG